MEEINTKPISFHEVPSDSLLHQQLYQNISFKSFPPLGIKDSLEEFRKRRKYSEYPRKNFLHSFVKTISFERRQRHNLYQKKTNNDKSNQDLLIKYNPEFNIYKMRHKQTKEKGFVNFDIQRLGKRIKNHFKKEKSTSFRINIKEKLNEEKRSLSSKYDQSNDESENITQFFQKLNIDEVESQNQNLFDLLIKPGTLQISTNSQNESNNFNSEILVKNKQSGKNLNDIQTLYTQVNFSSGDDAQNCSNFQTDEKCVSQNLIIEQSQILASKRRSVQWNGEVDVVYYAGDSDGGKIIGREREPLREEADQQARHSRFIELVMKKEFLSNMRGSHFRDSWIVTFPK